MTSFGGSEQFSEHCKTEITDSGQRWTNQVLPSQAQERCCAAVCKLTLQGALAQLKSGKVKSGKVESGQENSGQRLKYFRIQFFFQTQNIFWPKTTFRTQDFLEPNIYLDPRFIRPKIFGPNIFLTKKCFGTNIFSEVKCFQQCFWTQHKLWHKNISTQIDFWCN